METKTRLDDLAPTADLGGGASTTDGGPLPCPFCGHSGVSIYNGSTFRWRYVACDNCGAQCEEIRIQTMGEGTREEWEAQAKINALAAWNTRTPAQLGTGRCAE